MIAVATSSSILNNLEKRIPQKSQVTSHKSHVKMFPVSFHSKCISENRARILYNSSPGALAADGGGGGGGAKLTLAFRGDANLDTQLFSSVSLLILN